MMPKRIQRSRAKGSKLPEGAVCVTRPGIFGNPWTIKGARALGYEGDALTTARWCVSLFRDWLTGRGDPLAVACDPERRAKLLAALPMLRGKDLACWCPLTNADGSPCPCHANVLLELANAI